VYQVKYPIARWDILLSNQIRHNSALLCNITIMEVEITNSDRISNKHRWKAIAMSSDPDRIAVSVSTQKDVLGNHPVITAVTDGTDSVRKSSQNPVASVEFHVRDMEFPPTNAVDLSRHDALVRKAATCVLRAVIDMREANPSSIEAAAPSMSPTAE